MKQTAIITGASSGFGLLTAIEFAKRGYYVLATMRFVEKAAQFNTLVDDKNLLKRIEAFPLDVTDSSSISALKKKVESQERVAVLVNNAGFAIGGFAEEVDMEDYRRQFETNVFGVMAVTQAVLPTMREQRTGAILNMSSVSGKIAFPGLSPYAASKHALEGYTESLRLEMKPFGIQVALVEPGSYKTNIWTSGMKVSERSLEENSPYYDYMRTITDTLEFGKEKHGDPKEVAMLVCDLASVKKLNQLRYPIGRGLKMTLLIKKWLPWQLWEKIVLKKLKV
ncbi:SDR family oxidoreductase [Halalkalibacter kiskunsagensis]|uniref:SDR family oxidoreductase n=1 Tax=Halalkalibacter kiskunsagensis TaxID=1548599 RepID=A0ABV6K932_9BACI